MPVRPTVETSAIRIDLSQQSILPVETPDKENGVQAIVYILHKEAIRSVIATTEVSSYLSSGSILLVKPTLQMQPTQPEVPTTSPSTDVSLRILTTLDYRPPGSDPEPDRRPEKTPNSDHNRRGNTVFSPIRLEEEKEKVTPPEQETTEQEQELDSTLTKEEREAKQIEYYAGLAAKARENGKKMMADVLDEIVKELKAKNKKQQEQ